MSEWISIHDRLPEKGKDVLLTVESIYEGDEGNRRVLSAFRKYEGQVCYSFVSSWDECECYDSVAVAWMPLPEPYKEPFVCNYEIDEKRKCVWDERAENK